MGLKTRNGHNTCNYMCFCIVRRVRSNIVCSGVVLNPWTPPEQCSDQPNNHRVKEGIDLETSHIPGSPPANLRLPAIASDQSCFFCLRMFLAALLKNNLSCAPDPFLTLPYRIASVDSSNERWYHNLHISLPYTFSEDLWQYWNRQKMYKLPHQDLWSILQNFLVKCLLGNGLECSLSTQISIAIWFNISPLSCPCSTRCHKVPSELPL